MVNQPWFNIAFAIVTFLVSNLVAYLLYRRQYQSMRIFWSRKTRIVRPSQASPEKTEKGLMVSRVVFWNAGLKTISSADVLSKNPLKLSASANCQILSARLLKQNNPSNQIGINLDGDCEAVINFEFLKAHHGAVIELIHRGDQVVMTGKLKEGLIYQRSVDVNYLDEIPFIVLWFWAKQPLRRILKIIFFSLCLIVLGLALPEFLFNLSPDVGTFWLFLIRARALFVFLIYFWGVWQMWKTDGVPKGLSEFYAAIK